MSDLRDNGSIRYAILASMVEALVDAFNARLELGFAGTILRTNPNNSFNFTREEALSWTSKVGALGKSLAFSEADCKVTDMTMERHFLKRNIRAPNGYL